MIIFGPILFWFGMESLPFWVAMLNWHWSRLDILKCFCSFPETTTNDLNNSTQIQTLYLVLLSLIMILLVLYMIIRLITNPGEEQSHGQGQFFNNLMHNPALINNLQILIVAFVCIVVALPGTFIVKKTPNAFVLSIIPGVFNLFLFMPILFYAFNDRLRKFAWRELKERFELTTISTFN